MKKRKLLILGISAAIIVGVGSHVFLDLFFGGERIETSIQTLKLDNYAKQLLIDNTNYLVENANFVEEENEVKLYLKHGGSSYYEENKENDNKTSENGVTGDVSGDITTDIGESSTISFAPDVYNTAEKSPGTVLVLRETKNTLESPSFWPISVALGISASAVLIGAIISKQEIRGSATNVLLEEGLENLSVRDTKIVAEMLKLDKFTIPQLMNEAGTSKVSTWRTVKKLVEEDLVRKTEETRPSSNGLGGRGKPSQVYEFVGEK